jgi:hypothetical protein
VNARITVYDTSCNQLMDSDLNSFFGYFNQPFTDPRVIHDDTYNRFVVIAFAFPEPSGAQFQFIAVSVTDDALGPWYIFSFDTAPITSFGLWDFDQLGMDDQAIIITANVFGTPGLASILVFLNKQHLYYGMGVSGCLFQDTNYNWAPPKVLDLARITWLVLVNVNFSTTAAKAVGYSSTGQLCPKVEATTAIAIKAWSMPPSAAQPGTNLTLDTMDGRFQNKSTQYGDPDLGQNTLVWNAHAVFDSGFSDALLYRFDVTAGTSTEAIFIASGTSYDWNPSIAVDTTGHVFVTWSSIDPTNGINAQVRIGSCHSGSFACFPGPGFPVQQSSSFLFANPAGFDSVQRWGDYSSTVIDPDEAWVFNEEIDNPDQGTVGDSWGSRIVNFTIP